MIALLFTMSLVGSAPASPVSLLKRIFRHDPIWTTIAPCEDEYACVRAGEREVRMIPLGLKREGYEIVAIAEPGQAGLMLIRSTHGSNRELTLILRDGGQVISFNPAVNDRPLRQVADETIKLVRSPALKHLLEARTADQLQIRAEDLAPKLAKDQVFQLDMEVLYRLNQVSPEVQDRLRVLNATLAEPSAALLGPELTPAVRERVLTIGAKVRADLARCGFAPTCAGEI